MKRIVIVAAASSILAAAAVVWLRVLGVAAVETVAMAPGEFRAQAFGTGTVEARVYVEVGSKVTGRVVKLLRDQGDTVRRGELLAVLDDEELVRQREQAAFVQMKAVETVPLERANLARARASLEARRAAIAKALANTELARVTFDRFKQLHDRELIARQDLDVRSTEVRSAEADLANSRAEAVALEADIHRSEAAIRMAEREVAVAGAELAASESRLRETSVTAPLSGLILSREVEPGAVVVAGVPVFKMVDPRTVWVRIHLDESLLGAVRLGQPAQVTLRSSPGRPFRGEVVRIGEESDRVAEELSVEIRLLDAPPRLRIGEQAEATITTRAAAPARVLPASALVQAASGRPAVFIVEDGRARLRPVTIGERDPRSGAVELTAGIADGERVVVGPAPVPTTLRDGQR
ncbi:MAG TPA: efflux RND transporter periplasmic adaptor subunit, partial [Candidatus Deferrimicrobiaceae bacterium]|nr:efflux RND transporter periplasmic adaptor subunit [Candidatus Deferrimicrobiaceae bacterium]